MNNKSSKKKDSAGIIFMGGQFTGIFLTECYKNLPVEDRQPFYLDNINNRFRVHHGLIGLVLGGICLIGLLTTDDNSIKALSTMGLGLSTALIKDDIDDADRWFPDLLGCD